LSAVNTGIIIFGVLEAFVIPHEHEHEEEDEPPTPAYEKPILRRRGKDTEAPSPAVASPSKNKKRRESRRTKQLMRTSLITFIAMALHNLPEGLGVYLSSLSNPKMVLDFVTLGSSVGCSDNASQYS
jgi:zinc transporter, ZIP family